MFGGATGEDRTSGGQGTPRMFTALKTLDSDGKHRGCRPYRLCLVCRVVKGENESGRGGGWDSGLLSES